MDPSSTLNLNNYTLTLTGAFDPNSFPPNAVPLDIAGSFNNDTIIKLEPTGGSAVEIQVSNQVSSPSVFNNLTMGTITSPKIVYIGRTGYHTYLTVNGDFISGSSATATVSFVKGGESNITNSVTSYWCTSNGGITNIDCQPCGPSGCGGGGSSTPIPVSVESNLALALTFLGIVVIAAFKMRKTNKA
jgi:hypothetical protein